MRFLTPLTLLSLLLVPAVQAQTTVPIPAPTTAQATTPATPAQASYRDAAQAAAQARTLAEQARAQYPAGSASIDQTLWRQAAEAAEAAVRLEPGNSEYLALRADIYTTTGFWSRALSSWQVYFAAAGTQATPQARAAAGQVYYNLAYAAYTRQDLPGAAQLLDECLNVAPEDAQCAAWAGRVALESGDPARAQTLYARAAQLNPQDRTASYFAQVSARASQYGAAATRAFSQAYADLDAGRKAEALRGFQAAAQQAPTFAEAWREAGRVALDLGDAQAAHTAYTALSRLPGATASDAYNLSLSAEGAQYTLQAAQLFRQGYNLYTAGNRSGAETVFRQATQSSPSYAKAWSWLGRVQYEAGRYADAAQSYARAVELNPADSAAAHFLRLSRARL